MLGAGDQIDSSGVNAKVKDPGKSRGPVFKRCKALLGCSHSWEQAELQSRTSSRYPPFWILGVRVKPRTPVLALPTGPLLLVIVLIHESILNKGLVGSWSCLSLSIKPGAQVSGGQGQAWVERNEGKEGGTCRCGFRGTSSQGFPRACFRLSSLLCSEVFGEEAHPWE